MRRQEAEASRPNDRQGRRTASSGGHQRDHGLGHGPMGTGPGYGPKPAQMDPWMWIWDGPSSENLAVRRLRNAKRWVGPCLCPWLPGLLLTAVGAEADLGEQCQLFVYIPAFLNQHVRHERSVHWWR